MKRIFYSALFISTAAMAQYSPGYHPELGYAFENFTTNEFVWSTQEPQRVIVDSLSELDGFTCHHYYDTFSYSIQKDIVKKVGNVAVNQPYGRFEPFSVSFGNGMNGKQKVLDMSKGNAKVKFTIKNTSAYTLELLISLKDSLGKIANAVGISPADRGYQDWLTFWNIQPNEIRAIDINLNKNAYHWVLDTLENDCNIVIGLDKDSSFNKKIVSALQFSVVNNENASAFDGYKPYSLRAATMEFSEIVIGEIGFTTELNQEQAASRIRVFPNPAKERLQFSTPLENVELRSISGRSVFQSSSAEEINVQELPKGMYVLRASSLPTPVKVMVE